VRIRAAADVFLRELVARRSSDSLVRVTRRTLERLDTHLRDEGVRDLRRVGERHLVSFARELQASVTPRGTPLSIAAQASYLQQVRSFFAFLVRRGVLLVDPAAELVIPAADPLPRRVLTERQAEKLMNAPSASTKVGRRDRAILEMLYGTGIRRGECVRLDLQDIDLLNGTLLVRDGKGRKDRVVPLPERSALALDVYLRDVRPLLVCSSLEPALFLTAWCGRRLTEIALFKMLDYRARDAGLGHVHPHALRHTCATHLLRGGADLRHVQAILGHRWIKTTALYTRVNIDDLRKVVARAHPRERARGRRRGARQYNRR
jgi:integrase/recombinase XerD